MIEALCCNTSGTVGDASATENAMLLFMQGLSVDVLSRRQTYLPEGFTRFHFTSARKKMSTILCNIKDNEHGYDKRVHMKGASEIVLGNCNKWMN